MSDDIDIEEHELLDNPVIKSKFPDIVDLKKEFELYDEVPKLNKSQESITKKQKIREKDTNQSHRCFVSSFTNIHEHTGMPSRILKQIDCVDKIQLAKDQRARQNLAIVTQIDNANAFIETNVNLHGDVGYKMYKRKIKTENSNDTNNKILKIVLDKVDVKVCSEKNINLNQVVDFATHVKIKNIKTENPEDTNTEILNMDTGSPKVTFDLESVSPALKTTVLPEHNYKLTMPHTKSSTDISPGNSSPTNIENVIKENESIQEHDDGQVVKYSSNLQFKGNKIILGSKLNATLNNGSSRLCDVKVSVDNLETFLNQSNRYCKICLILFPKSEALADHNEVKHPQSGNKKSSGCLKINKPSKFGSTKIKRHVAKGNKKIRVYCGIQKQLRSKINSLEQNDRHNCLHCEKVFISQQQLIEHMYDVLRCKNEAAKEITSNSLLKNKDITKNTNAIHNYGKFYRCSVCSYYFKLYKFYINHLSKKHKTTGSMETKVAFNPYCKSCAKDYSTVLSFNGHIWKHHLEELNAIKVQNHKLKSKIIHPKKDLFKKEIVKHRTMNPNQSSKKSISINYQVEDLSERYLLKSTLFKCNRCDIYFLSGKIAADHSLHMDMLLHWKCSNCLKIFKEADKLSHTKQHLFTNTFNVYEMGYTVFFDLLFKCPKCATYYRENDLFAHYSVCEIETPNAEYCRICDILIDNKLKKSHSASHKKKSAHEFNNIFVESDIATLCNEKEISHGYIDLQSETVKAGKTLKTIEKGREKPHEIFLNLTYCDTCQCFVSGVHKLIVHIETRCSGMIKYVCRYCGLMFTKNEIIKHRQLHNDIPGLKLNDFKIYDFKTGELICPPILKYPSCDSCGKQFIKKSSIISHQCDDDYLTCNLCQIKLSDPAFMLHMSFHNYFTKDDNKKTNLALQTLLGLTENSVDVPFVLPQSSEDSLSHDHKTLLVYFCKNCNIAMDIYDRVIEHCQDHVNIEKKEIITKTCDICKVIFDASCFEKHQQLHISIGDKRAFTILRFDTFYFKSENKTWLKHLFSSLPQSEIEKNVGNSIYNFEHRIKMKIVQDGLSNLTLYKCVKCNCLVDSSAIYKHCHIDSHCYKSKKVYCYYCKFYFISKETRAEHAKIHKQTDVTSKSYRLVTFNHKEDNAINHALTLSSRYILYECRSCNGVVDKTQYQNHKCDFNNLSKCLQCGLLFYSNEYIPHLLKHKEFCSYQEKNMKVIYIGRKGDDTKIKRVFPSFNGIKMEYLFYKCSTCEVCVKDKESSFTHNCVTIGAKTKCLSCELYFESNKFEAHSKLHKCDLDLITDNITVITFDSSKTYQFRKEILEILEGVKYSGNNVRNDIVTNNIRVCDEPGNSNVNDTSSANITEKIHIIYKCVCGLHFVDYSSAITHHKKCNHSTRQANQTCAKCGLVFGPSALFRHLLMHHGNKNCLFKFDIIKIP